MYRFGFSPEMMRGVGVGEKIRALRREGGGQIVHGLQRVVRKIPAVNDLPAAAVRDAGAVEGEDVAAVIRQVQLLCQGHDALGGAPAGKHDFLSPLLDLDERLPGLGGNFFS